MARARQTKRIEGKTYRLHRMGATHSAVAGLDRYTAERIAKRMRKLGWSVRIEYNIWGNTYIWVRKK